MLRKLTLDDVTVHLEVEQDWIPIRGNASAIDPETDRATEDWIMAELDRGNVWAWASVHVWVEWQGITGHDYLGACSYHDENDFRQGYYYDDMVQVALDNLNAEIASMNEKIQELVLDNSSV